MKFHFIRTSVLTIAVIISIVSSIGIASAQIQRKPIKPVLQVNPANFEKLSPKIYGEVQVRFGRNASKGALKCKDLSVVLYSNEIEPQAVFLSSSPIFYYSNELSGNINTGKCNYSITFAQQYVGKKAWLSFVAGGHYTNNAKAIILGDKPLKMDTTTTFTRVD